MSEIYASAREWRKANYHQLKKYRGEWIIYTKDGVIAHDSNYRAMTQQVDLRQLSPLDYITERIYENEFIEPLKFLPVRFRTVKKHDWQPKYDVCLTFRESKIVEMLVDSGSDISLITLDLGQDLGYTISSGEILSSGEGVGGSIQYVLRQVEMQIDDRSFSAPIAWLQDEVCQEVLLGREVVFDLFDIEFKQAEEKILFKYRQNL
jgi:Aspartyl protease/Family of unknown function (DUF5678)